MPTYTTLVFTSESFVAFAGRRMTAADRAAVLKALALMEADATHPSLNVHSLRGDQQGVLTAYASRSLRIRFRRLPGGRKELVDCTKHYDD